MEEKQAGGDRSSLPPLRAARNATPSSRKRTKSIARGPPPTLSAEKQRKTGEKIRMPNNLRKSAIPMQQQTSAQPNTQTGGAMECEILTPAPTPTPTDPFEKMQQFMSAQFKNTNDGIAAVREDVTKLRGQVSGHARDLEKIRDDARTQAKKTEDGLAALREEMDGRDLRRGREIEELRGAVGGRGGVTEQVRIQLSKEIDKIKAVDAAASLGMTSQAPPTHGTRGDERERAFLRARRCLRLWPVTGVDEVDMMTNVMTFMRENLSISRAVVNEEDIDAVRRVGGGGRRARDREEVLVVFSSIGTRDTVHSYARNLAGYVDLEGRPTAGLRMEIPDYLMGTFKDLDSYGGHLRALHGSGLKRHINFDDSSKGLYMDVRLPGEDEWLRVDDQVARDERRELARRRANRTRDRLGSSTSGGEEIGTDRTGTQDPAGGGDARRRGPQRRQQELRQRGRQELGVAPDRGTRPRGSESDRRKEQPTKETTTLRE